MIGILRKMLSKGYSKLLANLGRSYIDFLYCLNSLHTQLGTTGMLDFLPADIRIEKVWPDWCGAIKGLKIWGKISWGTSKW